MNHNCNSLKTWDVQQCCSFLFNILLMVNLARKHIKWIVYFNAEVLLQAEMVLLLYSIRSILKDIVFLHTIYSFTQQAAFIGNKFGPRLDYWAVAAKGPKFCWRKMPHSRLSRVRMGVVLVRSNFGVQGFLSSHIPCCLSSIYKTLELFDASATGTNIE